MKSATARIPSTPPAVPPCRPKATSPRNTPYYDPAKPDAKDFYALKVYLVGPARKVGEAFLIIDPIDYMPRVRKGWQYLPGQRRTKLAPDLSFDTPCSLWRGNHLGRSVPVQRLHGALQLQADRQERDVHPV